MFKKGINVLVFAAWLIPLVSCAQKKTVTISIKCIEPYCGGARPTPEMEAAAQTPKPYAGKTVILVSRTGKIDSAKTNKEGKIKRKLPLGTYDLYEAWRYYKATPGGEALSIYDKNCLETEWKKPFMELMVDKKIVTQKSESPLEIPCPWNMPCILEKHLPPKRQ